MPTGPGKDNTVSTTRKDTIVDTFTSASIDGGDFPDVILRDGDIKDSVTLAFRSSTDPDRPTAARLYLQWLSGESDDAADAGFKFALWLEQVAEHVRDKAFNRRTQQQLEADDDRLAADALAFDRELAGELGVGLADDDGPF